MIHLITFIILHLNKYHIFCVFICMSLKSLVYNFRNINVNISIISYWNFKHSFLFHQRSGYNNFNLTIDSIYNKLFMSSKSSQIIWIHFTLFFNKYLLLQYSFISQSNITQINRHTIYNRQNLKHVNIVSDIVF